MQITIEQFGSYQDQNIRLFRLQNQKGTKVEILSLGGLIHQIETQNHLGKFDNICLNHPDLDGYLSDDAAIGAMILPVANRLSDAQYQLNGQNFKFDQNYLDQHNIHGGKYSTSHKPFTLKQADENWLILSTNIENYADSGALVQCELHYALTEDDQLIIQTKISSDQDIYVNPTCHAYFNLDGSADILSHQYHINSDKILEIDDQQMPTGEMIKVDATPFDLNHQNTLLSVFGQEHQQLTLGLGMDHCYLLNSSSLNHASATAISQKSGRTLTLKTDRPALQFYAGNHLSGSFVAHQGFCFEPQNWIDGIHINPNQADIVKAGETFSTTSIYEFGIKNTH